MLFLPPPLPPLRAVPIIIVGTSPVHHNLTSNQPVSLTVDFTGRIAHNLRMTWFHNSVALPGNDPRIHNTFDVSRARGRTELRFPEAHRSDVGLYRVVLHTQIGEFSSQREVTFQIDVTGMMLGFCFNDPLPIHSLLQWGLACQRICVWIRSPLALLECRGHCQLT